MKSFTEEVALAVHEAMPVRLLYFLLAAIVAISIVGSGGWLTLWNHTATNEQRIIHLQGRLGKVENAVELIDSLERIEAKQDRLLALAGETESKGE